MCFVVQGETYNYKDALILSQFKVEEVKERVGVVFLF